MNWLKNGFKLYNMYNGFYKEGGWDAVNRNHWRKGDWRVDNN